MLDPVAAAVRELASSHGFRLDIAFCSTAEMRNGIRELAVLAAGEQPTEAQRLALLENLRMVILRTPALATRGPHSSLSLA